jgi:hypothetical protein
MLLCLREGLDQASIYSKTDSGEGVSVWPGAGAEQLELQGSEQAFGHGVVVGVTDRANRSEEPGRP